ncbi:TetR/AcrR family transcriptional regulator [Streptomyces sp. S3(2020)]|uniref:TetR/AcrR family transcriptional regulator n=1 Tax=Streptomyces sp. S3(2020) TaxID=2732044 RepID=UPI001487B3EE|nr:TetR/AcrR family transcriptional regulator [Streptomyces sp. S3(2020)]NNN29696.1 TetR/AcrR family transcriptional regulator [Streptomyces sp. S3(2020)]
MTSSDVDPAGLGRRERKRRQVRDQLYAAAIHLFAAQGYEATTMDHIAERADVARATVFNHFTQKTGFLEEWGARRRAKVLGILRQEHAEELTVGERLRRYVGELAVLNIESRAETAVLMEASARFGQLLRDPMPEKELAAIIEEGIRRGEVRATVDPGEAGSLIAAGYFAGVMRWTGEEPEPFELRQRLERMLDIVLEGILR